MPSKQTQIENKITQLSPSNFQKFCDAFLSKKFGDAKILGLGAKTGTLKTTIGNPDTYFRKPNGKYIFVAYTTQEKQLYSKILEDIEKCFDVSKTGVDVSEIDLIIACHSTSTLSAGDDKRLHDYCIERGVELDIYGTDELARQICNKYRGLGKDFLGIEIDTNQILSKADFVREYDRNPMAAPLDISFVAREEDKENLINRIISDPVTVVTGKAGIGKTRLVLEALTGIDKIDEWKILCIKNRNLEIYTDLMTYLEEPDKYIIFVDDANEFAGMSLLIDFVNQRDKGYDVRIVATVRDYAKENLIREISQLSEYSLVNIQPFSDEEITAFLDLTFGIKNNAYISQIIRIAEGNSRMAYMAGKIALAEQSLSSIKDSTGLYDGYYSSYIEGKIKEEDSLCVVLGLIAVVKVVQLDNLTMFSEILKSVNLSEGEFVDIVHRLSNMELVDLQFNLMVMITDQCVANYMLYYTFFKKRYIRLNVLIHEGFCKFRTVLIKFINAYLEIFDNQLSREAVDQALSEEWDLFKQDETLPFWEYVKAFHIIRPEESFLLVKSEIEKISEAEFNPFEIDFSEEEDSSEDDLLKILEGYKISEYTDVVLGLLDLYASKSEVNTKKSLSWIKSNFTFDSESEKYNFYGENKVAESIKNNRYSVAFNIVLLQYIQYMLGYEFRFSSMGRGTSINMYHLIIHNCDAVKRYRTNLWEWVYQLENFEQYENHIVQLLNGYCKKMGISTEKDLLVFDKEYIERIITKIKKRDIEFACLIRGLDHWWRKKGIPCQNLDKSVLETELWQTYLLLEDGYFYFEGEYKEYMDSQNKKLAAFADTLGNNKVKEFIDNVVLILGKRTVRGEWWIISGVETVIRESCLLQKNEEIFADLLYIQTDVIPIRPNELIRRLFDIWGKERLFSWLVLTNNRNRNKWLFAYFEEMPVDDVSKDDVKRVLEYLHDDSDKEIVSSSCRNMRFLDKFRMIEPEIYVQASKVILEKKEYNLFMVSIYFGSLFHVNVYSPEELLTLYQEDLSVLQDVYFASIEYRCTSDLDGEFLKCFIESDQSWADRYAEYLCYDIGDIDEEIYRIQNLWLMNNSMEIFTKVFNYVYEKFKPYLWKCESSLRKILFRTGDDPVVYEKQRTWLLELVAKYALDERIKVVFSIAREMKEDLRREMVRVFLVNNKDYDQFSKLQLEPDHWGGAGSMIPDMQRKKEYMESLLPLVNGLDFLEHKKLIKHNIQIWENRIKKEQIEEILEHVFI